MISARCDGSHSRSGLQPSAGRPPSGNKSVHHLSRVHRTPGPPVDEDRCVLLTSAFTPHLQEASHLQVRNTLCNLVFRLQNESVMNFGESIRRSGSQDLRGEGGGSQRSAQLSITDVGSNCRHTPLHTPSWPPCCLLATGGPRRGRSSG